MKTKKRNAKRIKTQTMKAQKRKKRISKSKVKTPKVLKNSDIPLDLQAGGEIKEKLNDDDCRLYMLMGEVKELRSYEDGKIRHANSSIAKILQGEFSASFIRKSLSKLNREGMVKIQIKKESKSGKLWREITIIRSNIKSDDYANWLNRNSIKIEDAIEKGDLSIDLQVDINNKEPLNEVDYEIFGLLIYISDEENGDVIKRSNSGISKITKDNFSQKDIFQTLGKLVNEGLIQVNIYEALQTLWREIVIIPGFGRHNGYTDWLDGVTKNLNSNEQPQTTQENEPDTENSGPYFPLPVDVAWALREIDVKLSGYEDNYIDSANLNKMSDFQYQIFAGGIKHNMSQLKLTQNDWAGIKERSTKMASGGAGTAITLFTHYHFRVHLEALRLLRGKSLMEILYLGEINVQNEFCEAEEELYVETCEQIWSMVEQNPDMDISQITLGDIENGTKFCA